MIVPTPVNLETVDPAGRLDVLAYRSLEQYVKMLEEQHGIKLWDVIKGNVNNIVVNTITGIEVPTMVTVMLSILQANMQKQTGQL